jgi:hypothetical protein
MRFLTPDEQTLTFRTVALLSLDQNIQCSQVLPICSFVGGVFKASTETLRARHEIARENNAWIFMAQD